jgi:polysaccharide biosynthesis protein PslE
MSMTGSFIDARTDGPKISLKDLLRIVFKHKTKIQAIFLTTVFVVTLAVFYITPVYEATASLLIKVGREYIPKPEVGSATNLMTVNQTEIINSEIAILKSREVIERVINAMGIDKIYPRILRNPPRNMTPLHAAVLKFAKDFKAEGIRNSNVIDVSFQHYDPVIAAQALSLLIDFYKEKHLQTFANPESVFLKQQMAEYRRRLERSERALEAFKQQNEVYSLTEQRSLLLKQRVDLDSSLKASMDMVSELEKKVATYQQHLRDVAQDKAQYTQSELDKVLVDTHTRLLSLRLKEQELLAKDYRQDSRSVKDVRKEIRLVQSFLKTQKENIRRTVRTSNPVYQDIQKEYLKAQAELDSQQAGVETLTKQIASLDREIRSLDDKQNEFRNLNRTVSINEKNYLTYVEKHEEARISDDLNRQKIANISVIQAPSVPQKPVKPRKLLAILLAVVLGAASSLGYVFFVEYNSQEFSTPEQVESRLGLPVLTSIPLRQA